MGYLNKSDLLGGHSKAKVNLLTGKETAVTHSSQDRRTCGHFALIFFVYAQCSPFVYIQM